MKTLILGYGNRSRTDDGVGWFVVEQLRQMRLADAELLTAHQLEIDLAEEVSRFDNVIFVDAALPESPQAIVCAPVQPSLQLRAVSHYLTPSDLLALCGCLYGREPHGVLFSIRGHDFNFGSNLSPETEQAALGAARQIAKLVASRQGLEAETFQGNKNYAGP